MGCQRENTQNRTMQMLQILKRHLPYKRRHQLGATFREDGTITDDATEMGEIIAKHWEKEFEEKHIEQTVAREWASKYVKKFLGKGGWKAPRP